MCDAELTLILIIGNNTRRRGELLQSMFVCVCNGITDRQIAEAIDAGASSLEELTIALGVASGCGTCAEYTRQLLRKALAARDNGPIPLAA